MKEVLILCPREFQEELAPLLQEAQWHWVVVDGTEALLDHANRTLADAIVTYRLAVNQLEDLITVLNLHQFNYLPLFAIINNREELVQALALPIAGGAFVPVSRKELLYKLERMIHDLDIHRTVMEGVNWQGNLLEFNLIDLLQMVEGSGKDGIIEFRYLDWVATLYFHQGRPIQAKIGELEGFPAVLKMGGWNRGTFQVKFTRLPSVVDTINMSTQEVLVQLMAKISEQESLKQALPAYTDEIMANPFVQLENLTPLQQRILELLQQPRPLFQLLLMLPEDDRDILKELLHLWESQAVGLRSDVEQRIQQEEEQKGVGKFLSTLAGFFRRKETPSMEPEPYQYEEEPPEVKVTVELPSLTEKDFEVIREKLG